MKRKFVCGIVLCLAFALAGCGNSKEKQAVNYYQNELGLDREDAEELANELYGDDDEDDYVAGAEPEEVVVEPLPEFLNSEWYDEKIQIYDMVFSNNMSMTEEDVRKIVEGSEYEVQLTEDFDSDGNIRLKELLIDGKIAGEFMHSTNETYVECGLLDDEDYYEIRYNFNGPYMIDNNNYLHNNWYDKGNTEFADLSTRDDVLAYLASNGYVEVEESQAVYLGYDGRHQAIIASSVWPSEIPEGLEGIADTPHYFAKGAQSISLYRMRTINETDQEIGSGHRFSGGHLNWVNFVTFEFGTDGAVSSVSWESDASLVYGEKIN